MGAQFRSGTIMIGQSIITNYFIDIINTDFATRMTDHDMYRGDFGSSRLSVKPLRKYEKLRSEKQIQANCNDFFNLNLFKKYVIDYAIIGADGRWIGYAPKVESKRSPQGGITVAGQRFHNWSAFKQQLSVNPSKYLLGTVCDLRGVLGKVECETRIFKSIPSGPIKKYSVLTPYVTVAYGGWTPV
jgi:hypothetical protein